MLSILHLKRNLTGKGNDNIKQTSQQNCFKFNFPSNWVPPIELRLTCLSNMLLPFDSNLNN